MNKELLLQRMVKVPRIPEVERIVTNFRRTYQTPTQRRQELNLQFLRKDFEEFVRNRIDLSEFKFMYPIHGITDGLNQIAGAWLNARQNILLADGEYEWLRHVMPTRVVPDVGATKYVSYPSAIDGNFPSAWEEDIQKYPRVILDCAYIGTTREHKITLAPSVNDILFSASKTFGLPEMRMGLWFRRTPFGPLEGLKACGYYDPFAIDLLRELTDELNVDTMYNFCKERQQEVCTTEGITPSEVVFLGTSDDPKWNHLKRGATNRICLTEMF